MLILFSLFVLYALFGFQITVWEFPEINLSPWEILLLAAIIFLYWAPNLCQRRNSVPHSDPTKEAS